MKTQLTQEQIDQYQQNGFITIEGFLDGEELETGRTVTDDAVCQRLEAAKNSKGWGSDPNSLVNQGDPDAYYAQVFTQCVRLADSHEGMAQLMLDPRLGEGAGTLAGV